MPIICLAMNGKARKTKMKRWDIKTMQEFARRIKEHYPHTISIHNTIDKVLVKMLVEREEKK